jgi:hypothetical protein
MSVGVRPKPIDRRRRAVRIRSSHYLNDLVAFALRSQLLESSESRTQVSCCSPLRVRTSQSRFYARLLPRTAAKPGSRFSRFSVLRDNIISCSRCFGGASCVELAGGPDSRTNSPPLDAADRAIRCWWLFDLAFWSELLNHVPPHGAPEGATVVRTILAPSPPRCSRS